MSRERERERCLDGNDVRRCSPLHSRAWRESGTASYQKPPNGREGDPGDVHESVSFPKLHLFNASCCRRHEPSKMRPSSSLFLLTGLWGKRVMIRSSIGTRLDSETEKKHKQDAPDSFATDAVVNDELGIIG